MPQCAARVRRRQGESRAEQCEQGGIRLRSGGLWACWITSSRYVKRKANMAGAGQGAGQAGERRWGVCCWAEGARVQVGGRRGLQWAVVRSSEGCKNTPKKIEEQHQGRKRQEKRGQSGRRSGGGTTLQNGWSLGRV